MHPDENESESEVQDVYRYFDGGHGTSESEPRCGRTVRRCDLLGGTSFEATNAISSATNMDGPFAVLYFAWFDCWDDTRIDECPIASFTKWYGRHIDLGAWVSNHSISVARPCPIFGGELLADRPLPPDHPCWKNLSIRLNSHLFVVSRPFTRLKLNMKNVEPKVGVCGQWRRKVANQTQNEC